MAELYKSQEIYKTIRKEDGKHLKAIEGLYVVGQHLSLVYQNPCVQVTRISVPPATVVEYTEKREEEYLEKGTLGIVDIDIENDFRYQAYTRRTDSIYTEEGTLGIVDIDIKNDFIYQPYTRMYDSIYTEQGTLGIIDIDIENDFEYDSITTSKVGSPEPGVTIVGISATPLVYEDEAN